MIAKGAFGNNAASKIQKFSKIIARIYGILKVLGRGRLGDLFWAFFFCRSAQLNDFLLKEDGSYIILRGGDSLSLYYLTF